MDSGTKKIMYSMPSQAMKPSRSSCNGSTSHKIKQISVSRPTSPQKVQRTTLLIQILLIMNDSVLFIIVPLSLSYC